MLKVDNIIPLWRVAWKFVILLTHINSTFISEATSNQSKNKLRHIRFQYLYTKGDDIDKA